MLFVLVNRGLLGSSLLPSFIYTLYELSTGLSRNSQCLIRRRFSLFGAFFGVAGVVNHGSVAFIGITGKVEWLGDDNTAMYYYLLLL